MRENMEHNAHTHRDHGHGLEHERKHEHEHEHDHHHHGGCGHDHCGELRIEKAEKGEVFREHRGEIGQILIGTALFVAAILLDKMAGVRVPSIALYLVTYVFIAAKIYKNALGNIRRGQIFDENLLMILASIGAIVIGEYPEAVAVILLYRIGELFEDIAVDKSRAQISEAVDMRPEVVSRITPEGIREIPAAEAQTGDLIQIRPGERIPLDGVVVEGESQIDTAPLTGEPLPVSATAGAELYSGCVNQSGLLKMRVTKELSESMVTRVLRSVEEATASKPHIERFITRFARVYTPIVVVAAVLVAVIPTLMGGDWSYWLRTACTFLVISCPCALVISVPLAYFCGIAAAAKRGVLFKGGEAMEMISKMGLLVLDKTGTLTDGIFGLQRVSVEEAFQEKTEEENASADGTDSRDEEDEVETAEECILRLAAGAESQSTHPLAQSILRAAEAWKLSPDRPSEVEETAGKGVRARLPEGEVLCGSRNYLSGKGVDVQELMANAYGTEICVALNGQFLGSMLLADRLKPGAESLVNAVHHIGGSVVILTGDKAANANAVAKKLGIDLVHAELLPEQKLEIMRKLRKKKGRAMYVGDGINDAPVMAGADVSGAMGSGSDAAVEAADIVYMTSNLKAVEDSIDLAFQTTRIASENVVLALLVKIGIMFLGLVGHANMWLAVFADTGIAMICIINAVRILYAGKYRTR